MFCLSKTMTTESTCVYLYETMIEFDLNIYLVLKDIVQRRNILTDELLYVNLERLVNMGAMPYFGNS